MPAKLESRSWLNVDHSDKPRIFYIAGPEITYDDQTFEAHVVGPGEMLVRDERTAHDASDNANPQRDASTMTPVGGFSGQGATSFRWADRLDMVRAGSPRQFDVAMLGQVQVIHRTLDETITIVKAQELHAAIERATQLATSPSSSSGPMASASQRQPGALDLGGDIDIKRLQGKGGVYMDAPNRDIECDQFDYDYGTGNATLSAADGSTVAIITAGEATPLRARRILWNMKEDKLTISEPSGGGHR